MFRINLCTNSGVSLSPMLATRRFHSFSHDLSKESLVKGSYYTGPKQSHLHPPVTLHHKRNLVIKLGGEGFGQDGPWVLRT